MAGMASNDLQAGGTDPDDWTAEMSGKHRAPNQYQCVCACTRVQRYVLSIIIIICVLLDYKSILMVELAWSLI